MTARGKLGFLLSWFVAAPLFVAASLSAAGAGIKLVAEPTSAFVPPSSGSGDSYMPTVSGDGRYVLFASSANNLTHPSNTAYAAMQPIVINAFLRDRLAATTKLVSVNLSGVGGNGSSWPISISTNGQFALFESSAGDLVAGDTNGVSDIFVRDLVNDTTILVSVGTNGVAAKQESFDATMTPDGRFVAFASHANNLVVGDSNQIADVFIRDLVAGSTTMISSNAESALYVNNPGGGPLKIGSRSEAPEISADGRFVSFLTTATNFVPGVTSIREIYVRDTLAGTTHLVSADAHGFIPGTIFSFNHVISDDGQYVTYESISNFPAATGLIFRHHISTDTTIVVATNSVRPSGVYTDAQSLDMSGDGRLVTFIGIADAASGASGVFLWDALTGVTRLVSTNLSGTTPTNSNCDLPIFDSSGQTIVFLSTATNLTTNALAGEFHLYAYDLAANKTVLVDVNTNGASTVKTFWGRHSASAGARFIAFDCDGSDLVANDSNGSIDVFLRDLQGVTNELVSVRRPDLSSQTAGPAKFNHRLSISADGRYGAFASNARWITSDASNGVMGVFVRDFLSGGTRLVSLSTNGLSNGNKASFEPTISGDGRFVAFTSLASNLVPIDGNGFSDVFVRDLFTGNTKLVSIRTTGDGSGNSGSYAPTISTDGRFVLFYTGAGNIAANAFGGYYNLILRDLMNATNYALTTFDVGSAAMTPDGRYVAFIGGVMSLTRSLYVWDSYLARRVYTNSAVTSGPVAISPDGQWIVCVNSTLKVWDRLANTNTTIGTGLVPSRRPGLKFSRDGKFLAYASPSTTLGVTDTNATDDVFIYEMETGLNQLISRRTNANIAASGTSRAPDITADGRFVVYGSTAGDIVPVDGNGSKDVFLYDRLTGATTALSPSVYGARPASYPSSSPVVGGDGQTIMFATFAPDLIELDFNQGADLFFVKLYTASPIFSGQITYVPASAQPVLLTWLTSPGKTYRVEFKNDLGDPVWMPLPGGVTTTGDVGQATDPTPSPSHRFYRMVAEE